MTSQTSFEISSDRRECLYDITTAVTQVVQAAGVTTGTAHVYVRGATAGIMIQENWDDSVQTDVVSLLAKVIPRGVWQHDLQDGNGDAHLKAGLVGPSETVPITDGSLALSTWQNLFLCEFDGPRSKREIVVTVMGE